MAKLAELRSAESESGMLNLVDKLTAQALTAGDDEGAVAIEYVLVAGFVAVGVGVAIAATDLWQNLQDKLSTIPI